MKRCYPWICRNGESPTLHVAPPTPTIFLITLVGSRHLESQMMMAEGSSDMALGLKVTRYFSHGENSIN